MSARSPIAATARIVPPYIYEILWSIAHHGPLRAQEIADDHNRPFALPGQAWHHWTAQQVSNRLRTPQRLGLLERDGGGFWLLTRAGRTWMTSGVDCEAAA